MAKTLMAVDAGTGSVRAVLFSLDGEQLGCVQQEWTHLEDPRFPGSMDQLGAGKELYPRRH